jgi:hypothetical protein
MFFWEAISGNKIIKEISLGHLARCIPFSVKQREFYKCMSLSIVSKDNFTSFSWITPDILWLLLDQQYDTFGEGVLTTSSIIWSSQLQNLYSSARSAHVNSTS